MDTRAVAEACGTEPKILRRYLRDPSCPIKPVGSGARYQFTQGDIETIRTGFQVWSSNNVTVPRQRSRHHQMSDAEIQRMRDQEVWDEEDRLRGGPLVIEDIRDPRVRAQVRARAQERIDRLDQRLLARGMHISQWRDRVML